MNPREPCIETRRTRRRLHLSPLLLLIPLLFIVACAGDVEQGAPPNQAPTISGTPATTVAAGQAYSFTPTASDPDDDPLTFSITNQPPWANFDPATGALTGTPASADVGDYADVDICDSDGYVASPVCLPAFEISVRKDTTPPAVMSISPSNGSTGVPLNASVVVTFSEAMAQTTAEAAFILSPTTVGTTSWDSGSQVFTFLPGESLARSTVYSVTIGTGATDQAGNSLATAHASNFTTGVASDVTPPGNVLGFTATAGDTQVDLSWTNPGDTDFAGVRILYRTDGTNPTGPNDPSAAVLDTSTANVTPGQSATLAHGGLINGSSYSYTAFSYDEVPNYASGAQASAMPFSPWVSVSVGTSFSIGLRADGSLWSWGQDTFGALGNGPSLTGPVLVPERIGSDIDWSQITTLRQHTTAVAAKTTGQVYAWGNNGAELGLGNIGSPLDTPTAVAPGSAATTVISGGANHVLTLRSNLLVAWGKNIDGQLGSGDCVDQNTPRSIDTGFSKIFGGYWHSLGIKTDGTLWAWGDDEYNQLGISTVVVCGGVPSTNVPTIVDSGTTWTAIAGGWGHSLALKSDGTLWAWGDSSNGQVGVGGTGNWPTPQQVKPDKDWIFIEAGENQSFGIESNGTLWAWGFNGGCRLGVGDPAIVGNIFDIPTKVGTDSDWVNVSTRVYNTMAIKKDGSLWGWGQNANGQLGLGDTSQRCTPTKVSP